MSKTCETCRFWEVGYGSSSALPPGFCMRFPPTPMPDHASGLWPVVSRMNWCGEHQPREPEPEQPKVREPGWYWVRYAKQPDEAPWVAEWQGDGWWLGNQRVDGFVGDVVSPRLEPPV